MKNEVNKEETGNLERTIIIDPPLFQVVVHNDDFTPMEFVIGVLESFFFMDRRKAADLMLEAHMKGQATFGRYSKDYIEAKIFQVIEYATTHEHPLMCSMETAP